MLRIVQLALTIVSVLVTLLRAADTPSRPVVPSINAFAEGHRHQAEIHEREGHRLGQNAKVAKEAGCMTSIVGGACMTMNGAMRMSQGDVQGGATWLAAAPLTATTSYLAGHYMAKDYARKQEDENKLAHFHRQEQARHNEASRPTR